MDIDRAFAARIAREKIADLKQIDSLRSKNKMNSYVVHVLVIPPNYMIQLGIAKMEKQTRVIYGTSLEDAKKRAGIE